MRGLTFSSLVKMYRFYMYAGHTHLNKMEKKRQKCHYGPKGFGA